MSEHWYPIPHDEGYELSDQGNIRSVDRVLEVVGGIKRRQPGVLLTPDPGPGDRHLTVRLGGSRRFYVHHLVAEMFHGPRPEGLNVLHRDDDIWNNRPENLYYGTHSDNGHDAVRNGRNFQSNKTHCPHDHPYDAANTGFYNGHRYCRACKSERSQAARRAGAAA